MEEHMGWVSPLYVLLMIAIQTFPAEEQRRHKMLSSVPSTCITIFFVVFVGHTHRVGRVKIFFSSRRNWDSPTPHPQASVPPSPPVLGEGAHSLAREGLGESQFRRGEMHCGTLCGHWSWSYLSKVSSCLLLACISVSTFFTSPTCLKISKYVTEAVVKSAVIHCISY
jgi:hypothetical protein